MKVYRRLLRATGITIGALAVLVGSVLAALDNQPFPLIFAGVLVLLISLVGDGWEEIAVKFGDGEARVKRAVGAISKEGLRAVDDVARAAAQSPELSDAERDRIIWEAGVARARLLERIRLEGGSPDPRDPKMEVGAADSQGRRIITVSGIKSGNWDWTVEWAIELRFGESNKRISVHDGEFPFPAAWGIDEVPDRAELIFGSLSIYAPDEFDSISGVEIVRRPVPEESGTS